MIETGLYSLTSTLVVAIVIGDLSNSSSRLQTAGGRGYVYSIQIFNKSDNLNNLDSLDSLDNIDKMLQKLRMCKSWQIRCKNVREGLLMSRRLKSGS